jgi:predicted transcriptional regulator
MEKEKQQAPLSQEENGKCCPDKLRTFLSVLSGRPDLIVESFSKYKNKKDQSSTTMASSDLQDDDWIKVKSKKKERREPTLPRVEEVDDEQDDEDDFEFMENPKIFASSKFHESSRRFNEREEKRRQYKIRLERRAMREEYKVNRKKVSERGYTRPRRRYMLNRFLNYFSWWITLQRDDSSEVGPLHCDQASVDERANPKKARAPKNDAKDSKDAGKKY